MYTVKFLCGDAKPGKGLEFKLEGVKPGDYATDINIHNPNPQRVVFLKKAVRSLPERTSIKPNPSRKRPDFLGPDYAVEIDCLDIAIILGLFPPPPQPFFMKGFVVIESPLELDVVAVYTSQSLEGKSTTLDVEHIQPRWDANVPSPRGR